MIGRILGFFTGSSQNQKDKDDLFNQLPEEIILEVFSFFSLKEVCSIELVCKKWKVIAEDDFLLSRSLKNIDDTSFRGTFKMLREGVVQDVKFFKTLTASYYESDRPFSDYLFKEKNGDVWKSNRELFDENKMERLFKTVNLLNMETEQGQRLLIDIALKFDCIYFYNNHRTLNSWVVKQIVSKIETQEGKAKFVKLCIKEYPNISDWIFKDFEYFEIEENLRIDLLKTVILDLKDILLDDSTIKNLVRINIKDSRSVLEILDLYCSKFNRRHFIEKYSVEDFKDRVLSHYKQI